MDLAEVWARTRDAIELPRPSPFEWLLQRAGLPANDARLVATASAFRGRWLAGIAAVLAFAALTAAWASRAACGYSSRWRRSSPASPWPSATTRARSGAAAGSGHAVPGAAPGAAPVGGDSRGGAARRGALAGLLVPGWAPLTWLLPAFGFATVVLALSTWISPLRAAIGVGLAWLAIVWFLAGRATHRTPCCRPGSRAASWPWPRLQ